MSEGTPQPTEGETREPGPKLPNGAREAETLSLLQRAESG